MIDDAKAKFYEGSGGLGLTHDASMRLNLRMEPNSPREIGT